MNDYIPPEQTSVTYARVDDAVRLLTRSGVGSFLAKTDIKSAFRIIPIRPEDYHLLGMRWVDFFTMLVVWSWAVLAHVKISSLSAAPLSGLPEPNSTYLT